MLSTLAHLNQATISATATVTGHGLRHNGRGGVRCNVNHLRTGVLVLTLTRECDGQGLTLSVLADHVNSRVLLGDLRTDVAVHPFHGGALVRNSALGHQVVDVVRPVLNRGVANAGVLLQHNLNHCGVQGVGLVDGGGAALNVVNVGALVSDD